MRIGPPRFNRRSVRVVTPPTEHLVSLEEVRDYLRIPDGPADALALNRMVLAAAEWAQEYLGRALVTQTLEMQMDGFPGADAADEALIAFGPGVHEAYTGDLLRAGAWIDLPYAPAQSVVSITTVSRVNVESVVAAGDYYLDGPGARVTLNEGRTWPVDLRDRAAVRVRWVAGYGAPSAVPQAVRFGVMQHVAAMYECRGPCDAPKPVLDTYAPWRLVDGFGAW